MTKIANGWSIDTDTIDFIHSVLPKGSTILEFGSGEGTAYLAKDYTMYSVEQDWVGKYNSTYINAPIRGYSDTFPTPVIDGPQKGWYDSNIVLDAIKNIKYDLILIDGPNGEIGRGGFINILDDIDTDVMLIFDDVHRQPELDLMQKVSTKLNKPYTMVNAITGYIK